MVQQEKLDALYHLIKNGNIVGAPNKKRTTKKNEEVEKGKQLDQLENATSVIETELCKSIKDLNERKYLNSRNDKELESYSLQLMEVLKKMKSLLENYSFSQSLNDRISLSLEIIDKDFFKKMRAESATCLKPPSTDDDRLIKDEDSNKKTGKKANERTATKISKHLDCKPIHTKPSIGVQKQPPDCGYVTLAEMKEAVYRAVSQHKVFTVCGYYHTIRESLVERGWVEKVHPSFPEYLNTKVKKIYFLDINQLLQLINTPEYTKICQLMIKSRLLATERPDFYWGCHTNILLRDIHDNNKQPFVNRLFCNLSAFTSKLGLNNHQNEMHFYQKVEDNTGLYQIFYPRSYCIDNNQEANEFYQDYHLTAAMGLLKWIVKIDERRDSRVVSPFGQIPLEVFQFACNECYKYIKKQKTRGAEEIPPATQYMWSEFLRYYSNATRFHQHFKEQYGETDQTIAAKANKILKILKLYYPTLEVDGMMNLWIAKPVLGTCGRGIRLLDKLNLIRQVCCQNRNRYIIQKYIERPLLIFNTKFDIRQWFLITSINPLRIWMYKECYIRFSSATYDLSKLDEETHICNNAVQQKYFDRPQESELPRYRMWTSRQLQEHLCAIGYGDAYNKVIYPGMKKALLAAVLLCPFRSEARGKCFQLFGADFIIDEKFQPWLLEINGDPSMAFTTPVTSMMCKKVLEDIIKVTVDRHTNPNAPTGSFELFYEQRLSAPHEAPRNLNGTLHLYPNSEEPKEKRRSLLQDKRKTQQTLKEIQMEMDMIHSRLQTSKKKR